MKIFSLLFCVLAAHLLKADESFSSKVEPLLKERCFECHSHEAGKMKGGLSLDSKSGWVTGGDSGPAIVPGKPDESLLIQAIRYQDEEYEMPPKKQLSDAEIEILVNWVKRGAPDPRETTRPPLPNSDWWSLRKLVAPEVPGGEHPIEGGGVEPRVVSFGHRRPRPGSHALQQ